MERFKYIKDKDFAELPKTSGVYVFKNNADLIYIGKAAVIRDRVKNHFQQPSYRDDIFIKKVNKIGFFETNSEIEALVLEASLIKKYQPKFNVMWRDDKNYFYVAIEKNEKKLPFVYITHQFKIPNTKFKIQFVGPFVEGTALKKTLRFLRRVFPYYTVKKHGPNKCTYCHLDLCPGPVPNVAEYKKNIKKLVLVLQGKKNTVLRALKKEMNQLAKDKKYEEAGKVRDRIFALQQIMAHTHVINSNSDNSGFLPYGKKPHSPTLDLLQKILVSERPIYKIECYDISNIQGKMATGSQVVFVQGKPDKSQYKKFRIRMKNEPNDIAMLKEVLTRRLNHPEWIFPEVILIDGGKAQLNVAIQAKSQNKIKIISIAKGRDELFIEGQENPIPLKDLPQDVENLIRHLDDEAHRFAISYHKTLRSKNLLK